MILFHSLHKKYKVTLCAFCIFTMNNLYSSSAVSSSTPPEDNLVIEINIHGPRLHSSRHVYTGHRRDLYSSKKSQQFPNPSAS